MLQAGLDLAGSSVARKFLLASTATLTGLGLLGLGLLHDAAAPGNALVTRTPIARVAVAAATDAVTRPPFTTETTAPVAPSPPNIKGGLPVGKGMWIWLPEKADGGNPQAIVARAQRVGLTHIYVRTGSSKMGFHGAPFLDALLPVAHAAGIRVIGWDFPYLDDIGADVARAHQAIHYTTPSGDRIDAFAADIELRSMGVNISPATASQYGVSLRDAVGFGFPLIAVVPRPSQYLLSYPYENVVTAFDAIAPMIYWMGNDPAAVVNMTWDRLGPLGKPIMPVGQAYDGFAEGGPQGIPSPAMLQRFMDAAAYRGATGVSFWSWQHANQPAWDTLMNSLQFKLPTAPAEGFRVDQIRAYQVLLTSLGFGVPATGNWGPESDAALRAYQTASHLPVTGLIDAATRALMLRPVAPPLK